MTDWREELVETMARSAFESCGAHWEDLFLSKVVTAMYLREARAALNGERG